MGDEVEMSVTSRSLRDMFRSSDRWHDDDDDDEESIKLAAIERLPTYDRMRNAMLGRVQSDGKVAWDEVDVTKLRVQDKRILMENILKLVEDDNERFLKRLRGRIDRVGIEIPTIEVRYEHLSVEGFVYVGNRALPTLLNTSFNIIETILGLVHLSPSKKRKIQILKDMNGMVKPSRHPNMIVSMTLLLGPPSAGKTTLLMALAGKLDKDLRVAGKVTYCGHELNEFVPQRTCAYIAQHNILYGELTVRETIDFSGRCLGVGTRYEMLMELLRREKEAGIKPDPEIDAFMKAIAVSGQRTSLITDYILRILGLDICADTIVGNDMMRGISGGEKKRVTTGEMLAGPAKAFFMDEISTGLDSSTTFQVIKFMRQLVHIMDLTMVISLLQPAPETYNLFDDIILLSEGEIVYQGPREEALNFFEYMGFKCPERKDVADFLQEVISKKDQEQYWFKNDQQYIHVSVSDFSQAFKSFHVGKVLTNDLNISYDKSKAHPAALVKENFGMSNLEIFKACFDNERLLMKRNGFIYIFKTVQITIMSVLSFTMFLRTTMHSGTLKDGQKFFGALFLGLINVMFNGMAELAMMGLRLPVFYKLRDALFFPSWAFALPIWVLTIPLSFMESAIWLIFTYYTIGFAPSFSRFLRQFLAFFAVHQMALALFRFIAAVARSPVIANTVATFILLVVFVLGGFVVAKDDIQPFMIWGYYASPMMYAQNAIVMNEFLDKRWSMPNPDPRIDAPTIGKVLLKTRGFFTKEYMYWVCVGALFAFSFLFNLLFIVALAFLDPIRDSKAVFLDDNYNDHKRSNESLGKMSSQVGETSSGSDPGIGSSDHAPRKGMVLPFRPLSLAFNHINYDVEMPSEMKRQGIKENRLRLLRDVSGAFRQGILTALVGVSGAGKTTLMDVLAGRKTGGWIEGSISISGYTKNQSTFARVSGYCEQTDIHSPYVTVHESVLYSAWLRLSSEVDTKTRKMFVEEVMDLVELNPIKFSLVGLPGVDGLSTEQRKRLTIAVELVANPSIIFMDEPTSGLDARAAAIVMRTVRNTVDTGRTVVCTIHQPSIDIFEAFDELLLMKRGGQIIYAGPLGHNSHNLIEYFEAVPGVPKIKNGYNPATWMLDISAPSIEASLGVDFAEVYANSSLYKRNQDLIGELITPREGSEDDLFFETVYSQPLMTQYKACFWKQFWSYWRNPQYNLLRFLLAIVMGIAFGLIFWDKGQMITKQQDLFNLLGAMYSAVLFLGATNASSVQPIVSTERTVFYREKAAGMYSPLPYALAQATVEVIYVAIQTLVHCGLLYSMIGFEWKIEKVLWFYYIMLMCFTYFTLYGMMLVALTPVIQIAAIVMSFFVSFWNLFAGFIVPRPLIPIWWRWYYWCSPVAWTLYGLVTSQVGDKDTLVFIPGEGNVAVKQYLKDYFGYDHDFLPAVAVAHFGWVVLFFISFVFGIKYLNFQKR